MRLRKSLLGRQAHWFLLAAFAVLSIGLYLASGPIDRYDDLRSFGGYTRGEGSVVLVRTGGAFRPISFLEAWRDQSETIDGYARAGPISVRAVGVPVPLFKECYQIMDGGDVILYQVSEADEISLLMPDFFRIARKWSYARGELDQSPYADILPEIGDAIDRQSSRPGGEFYTWLLEQDGLPISRISWPALAYNVGLLTTIIIGVAAVLAWIGWIGSIVNRERLLLRAGRCPNCRYLLVGLVDPRCPECGRALTASEWAHVQAAEIGGDV